MPVVSHSGDPPSVYYCIFGSLVLRKYVFVL